MQTTSHCAESKEGSMLYKLNKYNKATENKLKGGNKQPDAPHTTLHRTSNCNNETWDCSGEQNTRVTLRKQQQRAQSSLTFATVGSKPITSTHI